MKEAVAAAKEMRLDILRLAFGAGRRGAHIAPALSIADILAVLFLHVMKYPPSSGDKTNTLSNRGVLGDRFVLSKGHGGLAYYTAMFQAGLITKDQLDSFDKNGGDFPGQPFKSAENKIEYSSGTLGLGLSYGAGLALGARLRGLSGRIFVLLGDGECDEGAVWEAAMFAAHRRLNLIAIVDQNGMQSDGASRVILDVDLEKAWKAFNWETIICDGHNTDALAKALDRDGSPTVVLAQTIKGKGVSFMENNRRWHHSFLTEEEYENAVKEIEGAS
ncbi:MAG: transketolase [Helicobacteraceae bacterium]|jgi:transketolase|nr:transketolase [Helicobacteraceae bacterium]